MSTTQHIETDYLVIGAGAVGLAFADTLLDETSASITIVDRHDKPGGHWNDAYGFVALHQPSAFYGVNSTELGSGRKDSMGLNAGMHELASGPEISAYFDKLMHQRLLPSGRVRYHPMSEYLGKGRFASILSGEETQVSVRRKTVDATYYGTTVPSTHTPKYRVADGVQLVAPNALPQLWKGGQRPRRFAILGAGKTAMDVGVWLLRSGAQPDAIQWVRPRDAWMINRLNTQPGEEFFHETVGGQADLMEAFAEAASIDELFLRLETMGQMLRIDRDCKPTMFHYATISTGEVDLLRQIRRVVRLGHVLAIEPDALMQEQGRVALEPGTLCIDCTASAVTRRPAQPIFQGPRIVLQIVRCPHPCFSAALVAHVEAQYGDDEARKNLLCGTVSFPESMHDYPRATLQSMMNQYQWSLDKDLRGWIRQSRLDGFGKVTAGIDKSDHAKQAVLARLRSSSEAAMANMRRLMAANAAPG